MKITILMAYYERPHMMQFALQSLRDQDHTDWDLVFVDDSSPTPGEPIVKNILKDHLDKVRFYHTNDPDKRHGASLFGGCWNDALLSADSDIAIMLCDDDALFPNYLLSLSKWYENNATAQYSYGHVVPFNPFDTSSLNSIPFTTCWFLNHTEPIDPFCQVDASQVSWRTQLFKESCIRFPCPQTVALDAALYQQLFQACGPCVFNGMVAQYKAVHDDQLGARAATYTTRDIDHVPE